jgi:hypothetical protein
MATAATKSGGDQSTQVMHEKKNATVMLIVTSDVSGRLRHRSCSIGFMSKLLMKKHYLSASLSFCSLINLLDLAFPREIVQFL